MHMRTRRSSLAASEAAAPMAPAYKARRRAREREQFSLALQLAVRGGEHGRMIPRESGEVLPLSGGGCTQHQARNGGASA